MKSHSWIPLAVAVVLSAGFSPAARANLFSDSFEMLVVAEGGKKDTQAQATPLTYSAVDGGYIEAGDPIVGDTPPTADRVRQALFDAMKTRGFEANRVSPSVLLTYYWGVIRPDREELRMPYGIKSNLNARLRLVSTEELGAEVENHILGNQKADGMNMNVSSPRVLVGPAETVVQNARHPRIFVIISAYEYLGLEEGDGVRALWRVKLSAQESSGEMDQVIPSLIAMGAPYFGKDLHEPKIIQATLASRSEPSATPASLLQPAPDSKLNGQLVSALISRERLLFSGANPGDKN
jgi:hypothetical protein